MALADIIDDTARAMGFLSRLPVPARFFESHDGSLSRTVRGFPLAGALIGLPVAILVWLGDQMSGEALFMACIAVGFQIALTGGLHEDGLADTCDGLGGNRSAEAALAIMKDSRNGTYGTLGLILDVLLRVAGLASLMAVLPPVPAGIAVIAVAILSRTAMVWHWQALPAARKDGVAASVGAPDPDAARAAYGMGLVGGTLLLVWATGPVAGIVSLAAAFAILVLATGWIRRRLGGHTGDTIGFCQQVTEITLLLALALLT